MNIVIVGLGKVGTNLAKNLIEGGHRVKMIEQRPQACERVANLLHRPVICGDGSRVSEQLAAETDRADMFIAVTGKDEINFVACQLAKIRFGVQKTVARVNNPNNSDSLKMLGIDVAVGCTGYIVDTIERQMDSADNRYIAAINAGQAAIIEITVTKGAALENRMIKELDLPLNCLLVAILREGRMIVPRGGVVLLRNDTIVVSCPSANRNEVKQAMKKIMGEAQN